jgi:hypothetical protein
MDRPGRIRNSLIGLIDPRNNLRGFFLKLFFYILGLFYFLGM